MKIENIAKLTLTCFSSGWGEEISKKCCLLVCIMLFAIISKSQAQHAMDYAMRARIIYRFTKYIDWPDDAKTSDFIIGIVGDTPLADELRIFVSNKMVGNQKITIKNISSSANSYRCQILFISEDASPLIKKIVTRTNREPVLLVSESPGSASRGACINFINVSDRLKLEINKNNIEQRNLDIASELIQLGKVVK